MEEDLDYTPEHGDEDAREDLELTRAMFPRRWLPLPSNCYDADDYDADELDAVWGQEQHAPLWVDIPIHHSLVEEYAETVLSDPVESPEEEMLKTERADALWSFADNSKACRCCSFGCQCKPDKAAEDRFRHRVTVYAMVEEQADEEMNVVSELAQWRGVRHETARKSLEKMKLKMGRELSAYAGQDSLTASRRTLSENWNRDVILREFLKHAKIALRSHLQEKYAAGIRWDDLEDPEVMEGLESDPSKCTLGPTMLLCSLAHFQRFTRNYLPYRSVVYVQVVRWATGHKIYAAWTGKQVRNQIFTDMLEAVGYSRHKYMVLKLAYQYFGLPRSASVLTG